MVNCSVVMNSPVGMDCEAVAVVVCRTTRSCGCKVGVGVGLGMARTVDAKPRKNWR